MENWQRILLFWAIVAVSVVFVITGWANDQMRLAETFLLTAAVLVQVMELMGMRVITQEPFCMVFGFFPSGLGALWEVEQEQVNKVLAVLALQYQQADQKETLLSCSPLEKSNTNFDFDRVHRLRMRQLHEAIRAVKHTKKKFWEAHGLAKKMNFSVKEKYADYVPGQNSRSPQRAAV